MIVPMKKIFLIVQKKDMLSSLDSLRDLGVVHIEHQQDINNVELNHHLKEITALLKVVEALKAVKIEANQSSLESWKDKAWELDDAIEQIGKLNESRKQRHVLISQYEAWGNFDPDDFQTLASQGIYICLAEISEKDKNDLPAHVAVHVLDSQKNSHRCVLVSREKLNVPFAVLALPPVSLGQMKILDEEDKLKIEALETKIKENVVYLNALEAALHHQQDAYNLKEAALGMKDEGEVTFLKGFCPKDVCPSLEEKAKKEHWGLLIEDPDGEDKVPTLLQNPKWIQIIKPVFGVINVMPGYKELDISLIFLVFFSMFFGILIGDAGYGAVFFGLTAFIQNKLKGKVKDQSPFVLLYVLSVCAIVWGILTGTVFGTLLFSKMVKPGIVWLTDNKNVQLLCFLIGAIHLSIAHMWRFLNKFPSFAAGADIGWILILWGGFFVANMMILGMPLYWFVQYLFIVGSILVAIDIFTQAKDTIFVNSILFVFGIINAFTDVVSYVRLFAVGMAGVAVADAFNEMALGIGFNQIGAGIITAFILFIGHAFNIVLCCFGVLVHGLRLNVLEFSGHLGIEWAGTKYEPFKKAEQS